MADYADWNLEMQKKCIYLRKELFHYEPNYIPWSVRKRNASYRELSSDGVTFSFHSSFYLLVSESLSNTCRTEIDLSRQLLLNWTTTSVCAYQCTFAHLITPYTNYSGSPSPSSVMRSYLINLSNRDNNMFARVKQMKHRMLYGKEDTENDAGRI